VRFLVCGGREFGHSDDERDFIFDTLTRLLTLDKYDSIVVIQGDQRGVDRTAGAWADMFGFENLPFPADWDRYGRSAGPIRNKQMLVKGKPDWTIAFPGGTGTANMIKQSRLRYVKVKEIEYGQRTSIF
jgi:hypothetical protein